MKMTRSADEAYEYITSDRGSYSEFDPENPSPVEKDPEWFRRLYRTQKKQIFWTVVPIVILCMELVAIGVMEGVLASRESAALNPTGRPTGTDPARRLASDDPARKLTSADPATRLTSADPDGTLTSADPTRSLTSADPADTNTGFEMTTTQQVITTEHLCARAMYLQWRGSRYALKRQHLNHRDATQFCQDLCPGAHLVIVSDVEEHERMVDWIKDFGLGDTWTDGIRRVPDEEEFIWQTTEQPMSFQDWGSNEPNNYNNHENCVEFYSQKHYLWNDVPCPQLQSFICEYP